MPTAVGWYSGLTQGAYDTLATLHGRLCLSPRGGEGFSTAPSTPAPPTPPGVSFEVTSTPPATAGTPYAAALAATASVVVATVSALTQRSHLAAPQTDRHAARHGRFDACALAQSSHSLLVAARHCRYAVCSSHLAVTTAAVVVAAVRALTQRSHLAAARTDCYAARRCRSTACALAQRSHTACRMFADAGVVSLFHQGRRLDDIFIIITGDNTDPGDDTDPDGDTDPADVQEDTSAAGRRRIFLAAHPPRNEDSGREGRRARAGKDHVGGPSAFRRAGRSRLYAAAEGDAVRPRDRTPISCGGGCAAVAAGQPTGPERTTSALAGARIWWAGGRRQAACGVGRRGGEQRCTPINITGGGESGGSYGSLGPSGRELPLGLVSRLTTRNDVDAAPREVRRPHMRIDMPLCHAKDLCVPKTFGEARDGEHGVQFMVAAKREVFGSLEAGAFEIVDDKQIIDNVISSKLIFDWKVDQFGWPTKAKARIVARGHMQTKYIVFEALYAPTVASSSARLLAALGCEHELELCHYDVDEAFVRAYLAEDVHMRLPGGCVSLSGKVVKLSKRYNGLRQASRQWYVLLRMYLLSLGFVQSLDDSCVC